MPSQASLIFKVNVPPQNCFNEVNTEAPQVIALKSKTGIYIQRCIDADLSLK